VTSPFQGCRDRVERAIAHRKTLGELWADWLEKDPYDVFVHGENDGTGTIQVRQTDDVPEACSLELGEALYQLRAALDGCIYQAAIIESGQDPPPNENRLEFPVCVTARYFQDAAWKIAPLSQKCRSFIESMQPYNTPELSPELMVLNFNRTLGILSDWARKDRHRQLHVVASWVSKANPKVYVPSPGILRSIVVSGDGFLENKAEIARFKIDGFIPGMAVEANPDLAIDIAVDEIPQPCADNDTLGKRLAEMTIVVSIFIDTIESLTVSAR